MNNFNIFQRMFNGSAQPENQANENVDSQGDRIMTAEEGIP